MLIGENVGAMNGDLYSTFFIDFNEMCVAKCVSAVGGVSSL